MEPADLEASFLRLAVQRSQNLKKNVKRANRAYDQLHALKDEMRLLPDKGRSILKRIAQHPDTEVRLMACAALLAVDEEFAVDALRRIAASATGFASFTAALTISEWQEGNLKDYWA